MIWVPNHDAAGTRTYDHVTWPCILVTGSIPKYTERSVTVPWPCPFLRIHWRLCVSTHMIHSFYGLWVSVSYDLIDLSSISSEIMDDLTYFSESVVTYVRQMELSHICQTNGHDLEMMSLLSLVFMSGTPHNNWPWTGRKRSFKTRGHKIILLVIDSTVTVPFHLFSSQDRIYHDTEVIVTR
jgi:hypothetical protein